MEEVKFRIWDKKEKRMKKVREIDFFEKDVIDENRFAYKLYDVELMQYIGFKDKNGVEIYEGDIVRHKGKNYSIVYEKSIASFKIKEANDEGWCLGGNGWREVEVIVNIFENSDILKNYKNNFHINYR